MRGEIPLPKETTDLLTPINDALAPSDNRVIITEKLQKNRKKYKYNLYKYKYKYNLYKYKYKYNLYKYQTC